MKFLKFNEFIENFGKACPNVFNTSLYHGTFKCACGKEHWFDPSLIICSAFSMRIMVQCPEDPTYLNNIKIKTFLLTKFKGFETLSGTKIETEEDVLAFNVIKKLINKY